jgi:hypothetical protein
VFRTQVTGNFHAEFVGPFTRILAVTPSRTRHGSHDWSAMVGYEVDARVGLTRWTLENRGAFAFCALLDHVHDGAPRRAGCEHRPRGLHAGLQRTNAFEHAFVQPPVFH